MRSASVRCPACCNPDHLFLGTVADNNADKLSKRRNVAPKGERQESAKLTYAKAAEIRTIDLADRTITSIAAQFEVSRRLIRLVLDGAIWNS